MRLGLRSLSFSGGSKRTRIKILITVVVVAGLFYAWHIHSNKAKQPQANPPFTLNNQETGSLALVNQSLAKKDYDQAVQGYLSASTAAYYQKDYKGARDILNECFLKVPDKYIPWYVYSSQASTAEKLGDSQLEKSSLQNAIVSATQPGSDVPQATVDALKKKLDSLK